jgi:hypothetical protein
MEELFRVAYETREQYYISDVFLINWLISFH